MLAAPPNPSVAKKNGAFYTPVEIARFLVHWAIRANSDRVLDPSHGGGVFLREAFDRIEKLGGNASVAVFGVEIDPPTHQAASESLKSHGFPIENLKRGDFFEAALQGLGRFDAVVGNPPYIRYQRFNGLLRNRAAALMQSQAVRITELSSSWAPFVIGAATLLADDGRLAMVVPMELCQAAYARPVLQFLARSFRSVHFVSFSQRLFPELNQETLLLLAEGKGNHTAQFRWRHLRECNDVTRLTDASIRGRCLDAEAISTGRERLIDHFIPRKARRLYELVREHSSVSSLADVSDVGIGYVTGANEFFHLRSTEAAHLGIPVQYLSRAVCRGRALTGLRFTEGDWHAAEQRGEAGNLLRPPRHGPLPASLRRYVERGESDGVHQAYKCRVRSPWYHVPHVYQPDAFLTYMSGVAPRLVVNNAQAVAPNTLHVVRMLPLSGVGPEQLAVSWRTSLTELSAEIEGHALGGGMLKLEPREAGRTLLALPSGGRWSDCCDALDQLSRRVPAETLRAAVDKLILQDRLGLTESDCRCLRKAIDVLRARRLRRSN